MEASSRRAALRALHIGLAATVVVTVAPFVDRVTTQVLAGHVRAGYPAAGPGEVDAAVDAYLVILTTVGVIGAVGWLVCARAVRADRPWVRWVAPGLVVAGLCFAAAVLTVRDTSGEVGLAPLLGWMTVLPCVAGAVAVAALWRGSSARVAAA